tara:strand:+ start:660 stop:941 length:282 start_codon:yes stop_codon:yes gene_type:complete
MSSQSQPFIDAIDKKVKLDVLKSQDEWPIIEETISELMANLATQLLNDDPVNHESYKEIRYKIEGLRMVSAAFEAIERNGKQAEEGLKAINGE